MKTSGCSSDGSASEGLQSESQRLVVVSSSSSSNSSSSSSGVVVVGLMGFKGASEFREWGGGEADLSFWLLCRLITPEVWVEHSS